MVEDCLRWAFAPAPVPGWLIAYWIFMVTIIVVGLAFIHWLMRRP